MFYTQTRQHSTSVQTMAATLALLLFTAAASAQTLNGVKPDDTIIVHLGQSKTIDPPWPVDRLSVTESTRADVEVITPTQVLILGKQIGITDVLMWNDREQKWHLRVEVKVDLKGIEQELATLFPRSQLNVEQPQTNVIVITGKLYEQDQAEHMAKFLEASESSSGLKYVNMTRVGVGAGTEDEAPGEGGLVARLRAELAALFPGAELAVRQSQQNVLVVTGDLASLPQQVQLEEFLEAFEASSELTIVNMATVQGHYDLWVDPARLEEELERLFPGSELEVTSSDRYQRRSVVVIGGLLRRAEQAEQLDRYLKALEHAASETPAQFSAGDDDGDNSLNGTEIKASSAAALALQDGGNGKSREMARPAVQFINMTSVAGVQQVLIHVRVAEVTRSALKTLGINVVHGLSRDNVFFGASQAGTSSGGALNPTSFSLNGDAHSAGPVMFSADTSASPLNTLILGFPRADLNFYLQALAEDQYLRVLAEPNLVALNGEEASFLAGGEFPIPVVQGGTGVGGSLSVTIEYKEFGVRLRFRPTVLGDNTIRLHVAPEVSDLSDQGAVEIQGFRIPAILTRRAETTLELKSGQTFLMAGLMNTRIEGQNDLVPGLGNVPVLGALFRSVRYEKGETELAVLVSAFLVEPMSLASDPPLPGALYSEPNDWELYGEGKIEGSAPPKISSSDADWLRSLGLDELRGPGAWATYEQPAASSEGQVRPTTLPSE